LPTSEHAADRAEGKVRKRDREVLDAAVEVFCERGYAAATVQDVADKLGILKGSLYYYIETKEDLLYRAVMAVHSGAEAVMDAVAAQPLGPLERLDLYVRRQVEHNLNNYKIMTVYFNDVAQLSKPRRREVLARRARDKEFIVALIRAAQGGGLASSLPPELGADLVTGTMVWMNRVYRPGRRPTRQELAGACAAYVLTGIAGRP
jgi:TetR/AcrR family transcriptional regulator, cholesterol catabolism regulator